LDNGFVGIIQGPTKGNQAQVVFSHHFFTLLNPGVMPEAGDQRTYSSPGRLV
jgi:orotidine-5'-phosphate decarboxylase